MSKVSPSGFTLTEVLITVCIIGIVAIVAIPLLSSTEPQRLAVAAEECANLLRFALSEAARTGGYVLVDGKTTAGRLKLYYSDASAHVPPFTGTSAINDPLTKRETDLDVAGNSFSRNVALTPQFKGGGNTYEQLLIGPGSSQFQAFDGESSNRGVLQAGSGILLSYGSRSVTVGINEVTGLVTLP